MRGILPIVLAVTLPVFTSGCVLTTLEKDGKALESSGVVAVQIAPAPAGKSLTYAVVFPAGKSQVPPLTFQQVPQSALVSFLLPAGKSYDIALFTDQNGNRRFDSGEPSGWIGSASPRTLSDTNVEGGAMRVNLTGQASQVPLGLALPAKESADAGALAVHLGDVVRLSDPRFSAANGTLGFWQPYEFLQKLGWGVYFLQPYDPSKIPVVFVYGIDGSPQDFRSMIASLDRSKFQPWFFHYPSGIRLAKSSNGLSRALQILKSRYEFGELIVVAHSMGGLVSRGAVQQAIAESGTNFISKFLTLCTPWGGDSAADSGVKHLKYPVPAWIDMEPGSKYLQSLFATKLPVGTRHYLIFDFQTHTAPWLKPDNDGVVQVASQLFPKAQAEATAMFGFNYGHVETLGKRDVHAKVNEYLDMSRPEIP